MSIVISQSIMARMHDGGSCDIDAQSACRSAIVLASGVPSTVSVCWKTHAQGSACENPHAFAAHSGAYRLEGAQPANCSAGVLAVGVPSTVNGARSNEANAQGIILRLQLRPQPGSCDGVHDVAGQGAAASKVVVGLIEGEDICWLGIARAGCDGCIACCKSVCAPHHWLMLGNHCWVCRTEQWVRPLQVFIACRQQRSRLGK